MTGKNDGILNKKIQAYDVIIWDDYFFFMNNYLRQLKT